MPSCFNDIEIFIKNADLDGALNLLEGLMDGLLMTFQDRLTLLRTRLSLIKNRPMSDLERNAELLKLGSDILLFAREFCKARNAGVVVVDQFDSQLLINNNYPFADRTIFRDMLREAMDSPRAQVILVDGPPKSGMSHLEKFIQHLVSKMELLSFHPFNIPFILDEPESNLGEKLAAYMAIPLQLDVDFTNDQGDQFKFIQFITKLKMKIIETDTVPVFFLHDFHKVQDDNPSLLFFIHMLIDEVYRDFPKAIFILAGLEYTLLPRWHGDLELLLGNHIYTMETVSVEDIESCLCCIFAEYKEIIIEKNDNGKNTSNNSEEGNKEDLEVNWEEYRIQYLEETLAHLIGEDDRINLVRVGNAISKHLKLIRN